MQFHMKASFYLMLSSDFPQAAFEKLFIQLELDYGWKAD